MEKNLELVASGIKCDNPECGWRDDDVKSENYSEWLNVPCPKCGHNLLTQEDFDISETMRLAAEYINTLSPEELEELNAAFPQELKDQALTEIEGLADIKESEPATLRVKTNGTGKVTLLVINDEPNPQP